MAIAVVISAVAGSSDGVSVTAGPISTSGVTGFVIGLSSWNLDPATGVTDNKGPNTYTPLVSHPGLSGTQIQLLYCKNPTVGSGHTFTSVGGQFQSIIVLGLSGTDTTTFYDGTEVSDQDLSPGTVTPTENDCIVVTALGYNTGATDYTLNGGFTVQEQVALAGGLHFGDALGYLIQTTAAAATPTWSGTAGTFVSVMAAFRSGAAPPSGDTFSALGVAI